MALTDCSDPNKVCNKLSSLLADIISEKLKPALSQLFHNVNADEHVSLDLSKLAASVFPELNKDPVDFVFRYDKDFVSRVNSNYKKIGLLQNDIQLLRNKIKVCSRKGENNRKENTILKDTLAFVEDEIGKYHKSDPAAILSEALPDLRVNTAHDDGASSTTTYDEVLAHCISNDEKITNLEQVTALSVSNNLKEMKACVDGLKVQLSNYSDKCREGIEDLYKVTDAIDQYGRRNILVLEGIARRKYENTNNIVIRLFRSMGIRISLRDIDRSHRMYRKGHRTPPIYIKFVNHDMKQLIYDRRDILRGMPGCRSVFIHENLTETRRALFQEVRKFERWDSWTNDGKIYLSLKCDPNITEVITCKNDLLMFYDTYT